MTAGFLRIFELVQLQIQASLNFYLFIFSTFNKIRSALYGMTLAFFVNVIALIECLETISVGNIQAYGHRG